jgi:hypothetical protein
MTILSPAPPAPNRANPGTFPDLADAYVAWLSTVATQLDASLGTPRRRLRRWAWGPPRKALRPSETAQRRTRLWFSGLAVIARGCSALRLRFLRFLRRATKLAAFKATSFVGASTVVRTSRTITAGDGLTGGGNLTGDRTITMGTPGSITATSTNSASGSSHTHSISAGTIRTLIADSSPGQVGTYAFLMRNGSSLVAGDTIPGSALFDAGIHVSINDSGFSSDDTTNANLTARQGTSRSGTWVAMGRSNGQSGTVLMRTTLFLRIA